MVQATAIGLSIEALQVSEENRTNLNLNRNRILTEQTDMLAESFWQRKDALMRSSANLIIVGLQEKKSKEKNILDF